MTYVDGRADNYQPERTYAGALSGRHINQLVRFRATNDETETVSIVTGELCKITITSQGVYLYLGVQGSPGRDIGTLVQYILDPATDVILRPAEDYSDVAPFLGNDPEYAQYKLRWAPTT